MLRDAVFGNLKFLADGHLRLFLLFRRDARILLKGSGHSIHIPGAEKDQIPGRGCGTVFFQAVVNAVFSGHALKGFDIVVDYFLTHPEYRIHIVGHIDEEVWNYYKQKICNATNILVYGFVDLDSEQMQNIARMATFVIMPSASEGCPGSVINLMKLGCIPIVTPYSAFDEIESYGVLINGYTSEYLGEAIKKVALLSDNEIKTKIMSTYKFANENFNAHVFQEDFRNCMKYILSRNEN